MLLHVLAGSVGHVLIEAPQQDGADHDGDVETQARQEAPALQSHVGRPDHQGLPRAVGQREEVVAGWRSAQRMITLPDIYSLRVSQKQPLEDLWD